jgi:hypothetical protein
MFVMAGHSRSQNGVASLAYARPSTSPFGAKDVDARHNAGHDGAWYARAEATPLSFCELKRKE